MSRVIEQFEQAKQYLAGGVSASTRVNRALGHPMFFDRAQGCRVWDLDGKEYINLCCSHGATLLGHSDVPRGLSAIRAEDIPSRSTTVASAVAFPTGTSHALTGLALLLPAAEPPPCLLSSQQLVELLKMPPCVGAARRAVRDQLGNCYHRTFADQWEFVRFAKEQHLDLDFTTPPQRPEAVATTSTKP